MSWTSCKKKLIIRHLYESPRAPRKQIPPTPHDTRSKMSNAANSITINLATGVREVNVNVTISHMAHQMVLGQTGTGAGETSNAVEESKAAQLDDVLLSMVNDSLEAFDSECDKDFGDGSVDITNVEEKSKYLKEAVFVNEESVRYINEVMEFKEDLKKEAQRLVQVILAKRKHAKSQGTNKRQRI